MVDFQCAKAYTLEDLRKLVALLRSNKGCSWDREQTHESIRRNFLEEAYEACEAIDTGDSNLLREELGDVLLQVLFHTQIEEELGHFNLDDVADGTCKKLISRHPHIFGDRADKSADEVILAWDELKRLEKQHSSTTQAMDAVAKSLPATWRADKVQGKARKVGFDWPTAQEALAKLDEETAELKAAIADGTNIAEEVGDLLFSVVNVARLLDVDPEDALQRTTDKFIRRFAYLERQAEARGQKLEDMSLDEMEALYQAGKQEADTGTKERL